MFTYVSLALALLKFVNNIMNYISREQLLKEGADAEIAKTTAAILSKTEYAKNVREKIAALDDAAVDRALRDLEPK